jgi:TM2 domain-containing membrane protein YozV
MKPLLFVLALIIAGMHAYAHNAPVRTWSMPHDTLPDTLYVMKPVQKESTAPDKNFRKEKLIASILAFPVPFGFSGLHRIYLGSDPWVPVAYLLTGGGGFGLLPLLDFIFIVSANEEEFRQYENNPNFFMFVK